MLSVLLIFLPIPKTLVRGKSIKRAKCISVLARLQRQSVYGPLKINAPVIHMRLLLSQRFPVHKIGHGAKQNNVGDSGESKAPLKPSRFGQRESQGCLRFVPPSLDLSQEPSDPDTRIDVVIEEIRHVSNRGVPNFQ